MLASDTGPGTTACDNAAEAPMTAKSPSRVREKVSRRVAASAASAAPVAISGRLIASPPTGTASRCR